MLKEKLPHERVALYGLGGLVIIFAGFALLKSLARPAPIVFDSAPKDPFVQSSPTQATPKVPEPVASEIVVHVVGAVKHPGLLRLPPDTRVDDAITKSGGAAADADLENINLAAKLVDGSQLAVPHKGKPEEAGKVAEPYRGGSADAYVSQPASPAPNSGRGSGPKTPAGPVSLNTATSAQLQSLPGVGPSTAQKILEYRQEHGGFTSVDELLAVKGIGTKKLQALRKWLRL